MIVGCVKEIKVEEYRVGMTPDNAYEYINHGHKVLIEKSAGVGSGFEDQQYIDVGCTITDTKEEIWNRLT